MILVLMMFLALAIAYMASAMTIPTLVRVAVERKLFDFPDRDRHGHPLPVPRLGGVAVFSGLVIALISAKVVEALVKNQAPQITQLTLALGVGSAILFLLGLYDDLRGVPPIAKLAAQTIAALIVCWAGFRVEVISLPPDIQFRLGMLSVPVTVLWLVGVSNAINLVDGMDGLAGGVAIIALLVTTAAAVILGNTDVTWQTFVLMGALLGFLRYNAPPARIFLGDSGSLVVGFLLAALSVKGATRRDGALFALAPIFALSYPLLDTGIAILRRFLRSDPLSRADGRHIHHQLRAIGLSPQRTVIVLLIETAAVGFLGLCVTFAPPEFTVAVACIGAGILVFVFVYGLRWLQYHEFLEASTSVRSVVRNARTVIRDKIVARDVELLIDRARDLEEINAILHASSEAFRFTKLEMCFDCDPVPPLRMLSTPAGTTWRLEYPIGTVPQGLAKARGTSSYLVITCQMEQNHRAAGPERVARILAPAIERWMRSASSDNEPALTRQRAAPPSMRRLGRASGETVH
jgi:UDP-GlcNAc:undecaprenyl-phosphate GlcNAc-1-phosphate transferase